MSILRDKLNEMYDVFLRHPEIGEWHNEELRFRTQVLNALYVVAYQLDRLEGNRNALSGPDTALQQELLAQVTRESKPSAGQGFLDPSFGDPRDTSMGFLP